MWTKTVKVVSSWTQTAGGTSHSEWEHPEKDGAVQCQIVKNLWISLQIIRSLKDLEKHKSCAQWCIKPIWFAAIKLLGSSVYASALCLPPAELLTSSCPWFNYSPRKMSWATENLHTHLTDFPNVIAPDQVQTGTMKAVEENVFWVTWCCSYSVLCQYDKAQRD